MNKNSILQIMMGFVVAQIGLVACTFAAYTDEKVSTMVEKQSDAVIKDVRDELSLLEAQIDALKHGKKVRLAVVGQDPLSEPSQLKQIKNDVAKQLGEVQRTIERSLEAKLISQNDARMMLDKITLFRSSLEDFYTKGVESIIRRIAIP